MNGDAPEVTDIITDEINKQKVCFEDLGLLDYKSAWEYQEKLFNEVIQRKLEYRNNNQENFNQHHHLLFCEHPNVYTLGKSGSIKNLLVNQDLLNEKKISFFKINRGGDITYHGPGQIVGYPILDLDFFFSDIGKYLRLLEEAVILTLKDYEITASRSPGQTGVWIDSQSPSRARKICAIGVRCSRWVTMHGFAFNVNTDLSYFDFIIPCGIENKSVTSMKKELKREMNMEEVKVKLRNHFATLFDCELLHY
ncbi:MAG: lipoyl(octanoyl) transferase LipB [Chitinophagales bacterium]